MIAHIGDRIVLDDTHLSGRRRVGIVIAVAHADGGPPYRVRWLDDGKTTLIFPGAEARIDSAAEHSHPGR